MTIKIEKETEVNLDSLRGELGIEITWFWVRAYEEGEKYPKTQKVYTTEAKALKAYNGLIAYFEKHGNVDPQSEIIASHEITNSDNQ